MKKPYGIELPVPDQFPDPNQAHPLALQMGILENENLEEDVHQERVKVPPMIIDGEAVEIFSLDPNGKDQYFHAPRIVEKIIEAISQGKKTFAMDVPGVTAQVIGNMLNPGKFYFIEQEWHQLLAQLLPQDIRKRFGIPITCVVTVLDTQPQPTIHAEIMVLNEKIPTA